MPTSTGRKLLAVPIHHDGFDGHAMGLAVGVDDIEGRLFCAVRKEEVAGSQRLRIDADLIAEVQAHRSLTVAGHQPHVVHPKLPAAGMVDANAQGGAVQSLGRVKETETGFQSVPSSAVWLKLFPPRPPRRPPPPPPVAKAVSEAFRPGGIGAHLGAQHVSCARLGRDGPREQGVLRGLLAEIGAHVGARQGAEAESAAGRTVGFRAPEQGGVALTGQTPSEQAQLEIAVGHEISLGAAVFFFSPAGDGSGSKLRATFEIRSMAILPSTSLPVAFQSFAPRRSSAFP